MRRPLLLAVTVLVLTAAVACTDSTAPPTALPLSPLVGTATAPPADVPSPTNGPVEVPNELPTLELPPPLTVPPTPSGLGPSEQTAIYNVVARSLIGTPAPRLVAIAPKASQGELLDTPVNDRPIPPELITALQGAADTIEFASFMEVIGPLEDGGRVQDDGLFLTLGVIEVDTANPANVAVYASFYRSGDDATGYRYVLTRDGAAWVLKERTQVWDH